MDRTVAIDRFDAGHIHRARTIEPQMAGGGATAIRILPRLGSGAELLTIPPKADQPGRTVDAREWESFVRLVLDRLDRGNVLLCSGGLPTGAPVNGYARLAKHARHCGTRCVIDAAGAVLAAALDAGEGIVVPNLSEAESVLDGPHREPMPSDDTPARARDAANRLLRRGAPAAIVTAGAAGAAYAEQGPHGCRGWVSAPEVAIRNPVGAGDAFAAGLGMRLKASAALDTAVTFGVAVAAAHVEAPGWELDPTRVDELATSIAPSPTQPRQDHGHVVVA